MTVDELMQLTYLDRLIEREKERLLDLEEAADVRSPILSAMPKGPASGDKLGRLVPAIADKRAEVERKVVAYEKLKQRLIDYIDHVPNHRLRLIFQLRFIDQMTWQDVAEYIGGKETEYSVKKACYRYVEGKENLIQADGQMSMFEGGISDL